MYTKENGAGDDGASGYHGGAEQGSGKGVIQLLAKGANCDTRELAERALSGLCWTSLVGGRRLVLQGDDSKGRDQSG